MSKKTVVTSIPDCDICTVTRNEPTPAYADCFIPAFQTWGNVCRQHFYSEGCELGTGKGQEFALQEPNHTPQTQTERIQNNLAEYYRGNMDLDEVFEDRDPAEFL